MQQCPTIADVKAAAERLGDLSNYLPDEVHGEREADISKVVRFAMAILFEPPLRDSPPQMTAERLAEIQRLEQEATKGPWREFGCQILAEQGGRLCGFYNSTYVADVAFSADARQAVPDLLAEVLRLRAELAVR